MAFRKTWVFSFLLLFLGCGENDNPINQPNFKLKQHKQTLKYNKKDCTNNQILNLVNSKTLNPKNLKEMGTVMAKLREDYAGQLDFGKASKVVKERLT